MGGRLTLTAALAIALTGGCTDIYSPNAQCGEPVQISSGLSGRYGLIEINAGDSLTVQASRFWHDRDGCHHTCDPAYMYTWRSTDSRIVTVVDEDVVR